MTEFSKHPVLLSLEPQLNLTVAYWVNDLTERYIYDDVYTLYDDLRRVIMRLTPDDMPVDQITRLTNWLDVTPIADIIAALRERGGWGRSNKPRPKATPAQLQIIEEAQYKVGLDFTRFFDELTTWEADIIIKGCIVVSEVFRQTGDRHFPLRDLRLSISSYILNPMCVTSLPKGRFVKTGEAGG